jgi:D-ribose pyranose/furanose isomerase RbsD
MKTFNDYLEAIQNTKEDSTKFLAQTIQTDEQKRKQDIPQTIKKIKSACKDLSTSFKEFKKENKEIAGTIMGLFDRWSFDYKTSDSMSEIISKLKRL